MGLLEKLKLKKKTPKSPSLEETAKAKEAEVLKQTPKKPPRTSTGQAYQILLKPIISEKGTHLASKGEYVFSVNPHANKSEIKKSIELVYDVHVEKVRIVNLPRKVRRYGRTKGKTKALKKAIVHLRPGEKIPGIIEAVG